MEQAWDFSDMRERKKEAERTGKENQMEGKAMGIQKQRKREIISFPFHQDYIPASKD